MGAPNATGGSGTGPQELGLTTRKSTISKTLKTIANLSPTVTAIKAIGGAIQKSKSKKEANVEIGLGKDRISNYRVENNNGGNDGNNTIGQVTKTAPTVAEVSQATTAAATPTETAETTESNRLLKIKKKGRSQSIMTSSKGVTKKSADYSLGKSSLLGKV